MNIVCPTQTNTFYNIFITVTLRTVQLETTNWRTLQDFANYFQIYSCLQLFHKIFK